MFEALRKWIVSVASIVIFTAFIELILPKNNFSKYVKFVLGFIVIAVILKPVFYLFASKMDFESLTARYAAAMGSANTKTINADVLRENYYIDVSDEFKTKLKEKIEDTINLDGKKDYIVYDVDIESDIKSGNFGEVKLIKIQRKIEGIEPVQRVEIGKEANEEKADLRILKILKNQFGIDNEKVKFVR